MLCHKSDDGFLHKFLSILWRCCDAAVSVKNWIEWKCFFNFDLKIFINLSSWRSAPRRTRHLHSLFLWCWCTHILDVTFINRRHIIYSCSDGCSTSFCECIHFSCCLWRGISLFTWSLEYRFYLSILSSLSNVLRLIRVSSRWLLEQHMYFAEGGWWGLPGSLLKVFSVKIWFL